MAKLQPAFSIISSYPPHHPKFSCCPKTFSTRHQISSSTPFLHFKSRLCLLPLFSVYRTRESCFQLSSAVQEVQEVVEEEVEKEEKLVTQKTQQGNQKRKLFVLNLPWSLSVADIKNLFGECGSVSDVEIIKHKGGKNRGFAFVTMATGEAAQAAVDKLDCREVSGRIIRVEFSRKFKKPRPSSPPSPPPGETHHKLYVSNLAWKVRSSHLREFFSANFNPVSARVVFDSPSGSSAGYGFISFATREEAETVMSALDGKELLGRPIRLKFSLKNTNESDNEEKEASIIETKESSVDITP